MALVVSHGILHSFFFYRCCFHKLVNGLITYGTLTSTDDADRHRMRMFFIYNNVECCHNMVTLYMHKSSVTATYVL